MAAMTFQPRVLAALAAALCTLFAASLLLTGMGGREAAGLASGANSYSNSAVGHLAFHDLLDGLGYRTLRAEDRPLEAIGESGVLILAEPAGSLASDENRNKLGTAGRILLVLPKWTVRPGERRKDWIGHAELAPVLRVQAALSAAVSGGDIVRTKPPTSYSKVITAADPTVQGELQLIKGSNLTPLISTPDGILLGELRQGNRRTLVLADPDPIENHGIGKGQNAAFVRDMVAALADGRSRTLVFDETIHGFRRSPPNLLKFLYEFPFNLVLAQIVAAIALLLWAAMGRFGAPLPAPRRLDAGRHALIGNAAALVDYAGHHAAILQRYIAMTLQDAARVLRAPAGLEGAALTAWLVQASEARGIDPKPLAGLADNPVAGSRNLASLLAAAQALHHWRKDMPHGTPRRLDDH
ncbi:DUF4350 domain-containing protein [Bosea sp. ANAM02]|uniref:DUF4350 domain-containing protein n=1 Tax=Bosea sp. ANAM02 TaxID=2020412 RepID=UPI00140F0E16|nr:DUF4350 domain-containing protein [Bosea sp. ANAM02]BCB19712.1 hypothetical protein OCUBac02_26060 [Bosea sp. ANAM02]